MTIRVEKVSNKEGQISSVKIPIDDWNKLMDQMDQMTPELKEQLNLIETPFSFKPVEVKKKRGLADFIMDF